MKKVLSPVTYDIDMYDRQKCRRVFHINMLRKWNTPTTPDLWVDEKSDETDNTDDIVQWKEMESSQLEPATDERAVI